MPSPLIAITLTALLVPLTANAMPLSLDAALDKVARTHPQVAQREADARAAASDVAGARWGRYPTVSAESARLDTGGVQTTVRVTQPLWTGGRITAQIDTAERNETAAVEAVALTRQELQLATVAAFAEQWRAEMRQRAAQANVAEHERLYDMIQRRMVSEVSPRSDVTLAAARLQQARTELIQAGALLDKAHASLVQLVGEEGFTLQPPTHLPALAVSQSEAVEMAVGRSPELSVLQARIDAATAQIGLNRASLLPQLILGHEQRMGSLLPGQGRDYTYVALQYQPGAGLSAASAMQAAVARAEGARDALAVARRQVEQQVVTDWSQALALREQLPASAELVDATQEVVDSYIRQYTVGRKSWLDVLNAQRELTQALYGQADARAGALLSTMRVLVVSGVQDTDATTAGTE